MAKKIVIVDFKLGNLFSVEQALKNIGVDVLISSDPKTIEKADALVLPGVGAFPDAMKHMEDLQLVAPVKNAIASAKPFLGICLGMQLLFGESEEFGGCRGLDIIAGKVRKFPATQDMNIVRVPQISWNRLKCPAGKTWRGTPLEACNEGEFMYFVHSFYVSPENDDVTLSSTSYAGIDYTSSLLKDNIFACQFHPEKSADKGLSIYTNWAEQNNLLN